MSIKHGLIANAVHVSSPLALATHGSRLPREPIQDLALRRGELAGGQWTLALQLEQRRTQG
ncbi:MAG: hypothetical protein U1F21_09085 [Sphaerotilus natans]